MIADKGKDKMLESRRKHECPSQEFQSARKSAEPVMRAKSMPVFVHTLNLVRLLGGMDWISEVSKGNIVTGKSCDVLARNHAPAVFPTNFDATTTLNIGEESLHLPSPALLSTVQS